MKEPTGVSVKAVLHHDDSYVLLRNERDEWELPGGQVDPADGSPEETVRRECLEELELDVVVGELTGCWIYEPLPHRRVVIVCYEARVPALPKQLNHSSEHRAVVALSAREVAALSNEELPAGYRSAVARVAASK